MLPKIANLFSSLYIAVDFKFHHGIAKSNHDCSNNGQVQEVLVDRAAHAAAARFLSLGATNASITEWLLKQSVSTRREKFELNMLDFKTAQHNFVPSAMQGIAKGGTEIGRSGWDEVGGLLETRRALQEVSKLFS